MITTSPEPEPEPSAKPCDDCRNAAPYTPIMFGDMDMNSTFPHLCDACALTRQRAHEAQQKQERITRAQVTLANVVPPRLRDTAIDHPAFNREAWATIGQIDVHDSRNIVLIGPAGLCKSRMLALLCKRAALRAMSVAWVTAHDFALLADRYKNFRTRADAHEEIARLRHAERLVFDDLGKEDWTSKIEETFFHVIDFRHSHLKPTWFSCNTHPQHMLLEGRLTRDRGAAIIGRILEDAMELTLTHKPQP
jgi:DNA replication protein DnaC